MNNGNDLNLHSMTKLSGGFAPGWGYTNKRDNGLMKSCIIYAIDIDLSPTPVSPSARKNP